MKRKTLLRILITAKLWKKIPENIVHLLPNKKGDIAAAGVPPTQRGKLTPNEQGFENAST